MIKKGLETAKQIQKSCENNYRFEYYNSINPDKNYYSKKYKHLGELRHDYAYLIKQAGNVVGKKVLDTSCGTGDFLSYLKGDKTHCFGFDYSKPSIFAANIAKDPSHHYCISDAQYIPFKSNSFDIIFSSHFVEHLYEKELLKYFREVSRILKPNGKFIVHTCPNKWYRYTIYRFYTRWVRMVLYPFLNLFLKNKISQIPPLEEFKKQAYQKKNKSLLHVNEKSPNGLKKSLRNAGFEDFKVWAYGEPFSFKSWMLPIYIVELLYPLPKLLPAFFTNHIWALCVKNKSGIT